MTIERNWNQSPGWFYTLDKETQARLIADLHLSYETPEQSTKGKKEAKYRALRKAQARRPDNAEAAK